MDFKRYLVLFLTLFLAITACSSTPDQASSLPSKEAAVAMSFPESGRHWQIVATESEARFMIDEILRGEPKTVVGTTRQVSGTLGIDLSDLALSAIGPVHIDASSITTDNTFRNRAIQDRILLTRIYPQIIYTPVAIAGLEGEFRPGDTADFTIEGELTIAETTRPVSFQVEAELVSLARLQGQATATINRNDFDLIIPSAPSVAAVGEEIALELDFVARIDEK